MIASTKCATALALAALAIPILGGAAEARHGVKPYYSESYETKGPARGYEGFLFPDYYCSYKRYPNRACAGARALPRHRVAAGSDLSVTGSGAQN